MLLRGEYRRWSCSVSGPQRQVVSFVVVVCLREEMELLLLQQQLLHSCDGRGGRCILSTRGDWDVLRSLFTISWPSIEVERESHTYQARSSSTPSTTSRHLSNPVATSVLSWFNQTLLTQARARSQNFHSLT